MRTIYIYFKLQNIEPFNKIRTRFRWSNLFHTLFDHSGLTRTERACRAIHFYKKNLLDFRWNVGFTDSILVVLPERGENKKWSEVQFKYFVLRLFFYTKILNGIVKQENIIYRSSVYWIFPGAQDLKFLIGHWDVFQMDGCSIKDVVQTKPVSDHRYRSKSQRFGNLATMRISLRRSTKGEKYNGFKPGF